VGPDRQQNDQARPSSFDEEIQQANARLQADEVMGVMTVHIAAVTRQNELARLRGQDPLVRIFATRALAAAPFDRQLLDFALQRLGVSPVETELSSQVQQRAQEIQIMLETMGEDFDTAFLESQVAVQREIIDVLDESNACHQVRIRGCSGFGGNLGIGETLPLEFDEAALFTRMRSSLIAQMTEASTLMSMLAAVGSPP
jgi:hypothetical protein